MRCSLRGNKTALAAVLLGAGLLSFACGGGKGRTTDEAPAGKHVRHRPSILLLTIDTLRADHLPFYGSERDTAPNLARLAQGAVVYDRAYSTSSWTVPSVVSWLTGVTPFTHGVVGGIARKGRIYEQQVIPTELQCLPEVLQRLGYHTWGVTANAHLDAEHGFGRGFERFTCLGFSAAPDVNRVVKGWFRTPDADGRPLFLWVHYFDPHTPYIPRSPWFKRFAPDITEHEMAMLRLAYKKWPRIPSEIRGNLGRYVELAKALYDSEIAFCDRFVGELFREFPELERSWIVFAADHGEEFRDHGSVGHGHSLYNETVRIPLFVRPPGGGPANRNATPVSAVDITRTILAIAGSGAEGQWQGFVLPGLPLAGSGTRDVPPLAHLARFPDKKHLAAVIGHRWKLIRDLKTGEEELYDLENDFGERHDLASTDPEQRSTMASTLSELVRQLPPPPENEITRAISKRREQQLRSLGYLQ